MLNGSIRELDKNLNHILNTRTEIRRFLNRCSSLVLLISAMALTGIAQTSVLTQHNDNSRTGQNTNEKILTTSNVNVSSFGKLFSVAVDGQVYAQPLFVPNVVVGGITHNVLIVATENDSVYAFDADSNAGANASPLWKASMVDVKHGVNPAESALNSANTIGCTDMEPLIGITATPVIDASTKTIYVEAKSTDGVNYHHRLHALDLLTGNEKAPGPVVISATVPGTGDGSVITNGKSTVSFDDLHQLARPGLLLLNGAIYVAYASHCDFSPYHGWLFAYDEKTLAQTSLFISNPNGGLGGFWMAGSGIAADANGNIFTVTGNGDFDATAMTGSNTEYGDSILKLSTTNEQLALQDYFTPFDQQNLTNGDVDLGSGGVLLLPDQTGNHPHILVQAGKGGTIYVIDRDQLTTNNSHYCPAPGCSSNPEIIEEDPGAVGGMWSMPAYWNNTLYFWGSSDVLKSIPISNGLPNFSSVTSGTTSIGFPGATPSVSSNGITAGSGVVWGIDSTQYGSPNGCSAAPAVLHAYNATNITSELWNSSQAAMNRDQAGFATKFAVPTIANGKVYIGTSVGVPPCSDTSAATGEVDVYGLFNTGSTAKAQMISPTPGTTLSGTSVTFNWTAGTGVTDYSLYVGTQPSSYNLFLQFEPGTLSQTVNVPASGGAIYVRLWSYINGVWQYNDYTYTASGAPAKSTMISPTPGTPLSGASVTFTWTPGTGVTYNSLFIGTQPGTYNLFIQFEPSSTSQTVTIPTSGGAIYVRLWSYINGVWQYNDYTYTASGAPAKSTMVNPIPSSTLSGASVTFNWTPGSGVTYNSLFVGTQPGTYNLFIQFEPSSTSQTVTIPASGGAIYVRLWSYINGVWQYNDYTYTASGTPAKSTMVNPIPSSTLSGASVTFNWTPGTGVTYNSLYVGTTPGGYDKFFQFEPSSTSQTVTTLPANGTTIYVRLWSYIDGQWTFNDYAYINTP